MRQPIHSYCCTYIGVLYHGSIEVESPHAVMVGTCIGDVISGYMLGFTRYVPRSLSQLAQEMTVVIGKLQVKPSIDWTAL